ncbi:MAG: type I restriction endonuclease subunit R, partial [Chloroflexi bacterium]|nr:type I restriction endonuclease subunit R [Chloroflexota bacterium]
MSQKYTEDVLVEQPTIALLSSLGWEPLNCYEETFGSGGTLGRETSYDVVLQSRLRPALKKLNPTIPPEAFTPAIEELVRDRSLVSLAEANREIYTLLKDGVKVTYRNREGVETDETIRIIDWDHPENDDFFLASQFWVTGEMYKRRADLVGFVNGLPMIFIELKAAHKRLESAYQNNLRDYKETIPQLFWYNAFVILSNGSQSRLGTITGKWEHFNDWKKINSEGDQGVISLETMLRGVCDPVHLLDIVENFILFTEAQGGLLKLIAKNHQYLGVNNAFQAVIKNREQKGRLGVFWHTQGSGKSYSMIMFAQKVLRKLPGNWTFTIVTDRKELDDQIYKNFAGAGAVTEPQERVRAGSGEHLKQLLQEDHRYVFTLIQKFFTEKGETYPALSQRDDIIVMTDEAHRSQYDVLALNMRNSLPNAAFIGFTGTPLMAGEERTRHVFGDYVSIYNFKQSVEDGATVPLYYENRIPELQLTNQQLNTEMELLLEQAELDETQEAKLEREFSREYHLVTRDDRLEKIAEDIVLHFMGRGFPGKAMVVSVDKAAAVKMYDKVQKYWKIHLAMLQAELETCDEMDRPDLEARIKFMIETDMAVVVSQGQNEITELEANGANIRPHRLRMVREDLDTKFKDPDDPFRMAFVCAMWMTGFDVPSCSTIYLDKPMRNHTLMQTIARANRVFGEKVNGLIVDYI